MGFQWTVHFDAEFFQAPAAGKTKLGFQTSSKKNLRPGSKKITSQREGS
jgi:hypothetical protein